MTTRSGHRPDPRSELLTIDGLRVELGGLPVVRQVSLTVTGASVHCLVGQSGSGKTLTSLAAVGLLPGAARTSGRIGLRGVGGDLLRFDQHRWSDIRGASIGYVGQNALGCLHPAFRVETQLIEAIRRHRSVSRADARAAGDRGVGRRRPATIRSGWPAPDPAELSGGMCQRVALAIALCNRPAVLIADEPTTALDDDTQESCARPHPQSRAERDGLGVLLITHDQRVVEAMTADDVTTITDGRLLPRSRSSKADDRRARNGTDGTPPGRVNRVRHQRARTSHSDDADGGDTLDGGDTAGDEPTLEIDRRRQDLRAGRAGFRRPPDPRPPRRHDLGPRPVRRSGSSVAPGPARRPWPRSSPGCSARPRASVRIGGRPITGDDRVGRVEKAGLVQYVFQNPYGSLNPRRTRPLPRWRSP